jgi:hypothetical protein
MLFDQICDWENLLRATHKAAKGKKDKPTVSPFLFHKETALLTYGDRVQNHLSDLLERLIRAFYAPPTRKKELLLEVNVDLEILRHYIRLGFDLNLFKATQYHDFSNRIDEIGRMAGGWLKSLP